jgi:tripartite-type tricarboxylate transporter receptor subunit TctC
MAAMGTTGGLKPHVLAGELKIVVVFTEQRLKDYPEVPTSQERGYVDASSLNDILSVVIHRDTPPDRVRKLDESLKAVVGDPEFEKICDDLGVKYGYASGETVRAGISKMEKLGVPLLKEFKLFVE